MKVKKIVKNVYTVKLDGDEDGVSSEVLISELEADGKTVVGPMGSDHFVIHSETRNQTNIQKLVNSLPRLVAAYYKNRKDNKTKSEKEARTYLRKLVKLKVPKNSIAPLYKRLNYLVDDAKKYFSEESFTVVSYDIYPEYIRLKAGIDAYNSKNFVFAFALLSELHISIDSEGNLKSVLHVLPDKLRLKMEKEFNRYIEAVA